MNNSLVEVDKLLTLAVQMTDNDAVYKAWKLVRKMIEEVI